MRVAIVGTGYQADVYMKTFALHPQIEIAGGWDVDPERLAAFTAHHGLPSYSSMEEVLADETVGMVLNVTNPRSHWEVSSQALDAGKHVYSEKPLAMTMDEARDLVDRARRNGVVLAGAPCNQLGEHIDQVRDTLRDRAAELGRTLLVHAEMDDGMIPTMAPETWRSDSGAPWPVRDEFEVGCTLEHAGYQIGPLVTLFGPVRAVTAYNACLMPEKLDACGGTVLSPDFSVGMLEFDGGVAARLTCSILAPADRSMRIVCEHGVLTIGDVWQYDAPLRFSPTGRSRRARLLRRIEHAGVHAIAPGTALGWRLRGDMRARMRASGLDKVDLVYRMDFARGIAQVVDQVERGVPTSMDADFALHVTEVTLAITSPDAGRGRVEMTTAAALDGRFPQRAGAS